MKRYRRSIVTGVATMALAVGMFAGLGPGPSSASSHREAPLVSADPQIDNTDLYAFVSPDNPRTVTILSNWIPFEEPAGGPNFYPWADGRALRRQHRQRRRRVRRTSIYRWDFTSHYRNTDTFLYNTGPVTSLERPGPELLPDVRPDPDRRRRGQAEAGSRTTHLGAVRRGRRVDARLRQPA